MQHHTEAAATQATVATLPWVGKNKKEMADGAAVGAIWGHFAGISDFGVISVSCEGAKDGAPHLPPNEVMGNVSNVVYELVADPIEGTTPTSKGEIGGRSLVALAFGTDSFMPWLGVDYAEKLALPPKLMDDDINIDWALGPKSEWHLGALDTVTKVAKAARVSVRDVTVYTLDRPRNNHITLLKGAVNVVHIPSGDFRIVEMTQRCRPDHPIMLMGSGGTPEGVMSALVNPLGFSMMLLPRNGADEQYPDLAKYAGKVLGYSELVNSDHAVLSVASITGDPECGYQPPQICGNFTKVHVRSYAVQKGDHHIGEQIIRHPHN